MTREPGDITRQWWYLFQTFPLEHRDQEIATWITERRVGALIALFEQDKTAALEGLRSLRRRHPKQYERARREHLGEYDWDEEALDDEGLTERQWEQQQADRERREAEYEWVEQQYERFLYVLQGRARLVRRIRELNERETAGPES